MEEVEIAGQLKVPLGGGVATMDYVRWRNRCWLVPIWLEPVTGGRIRPLRLIAPRIAPGYEAPAGPELLQLFQNMPLPESVYLMGHIPANLANIVMIVESPPVFRMA